MKNLFFLDVPYKALLEIDRLGSFSSGTYQFSKHLGITSCHIYNIIIKLKDAGLIEVSKKRNRNIIKITKRGEEVAKNIRKIIALLEEVD